MGLLRYFPILPGHAWVPCMLGWVLGTALQLQQVQLWGFWNYLLSATAGVGALAIIGIYRRPALWLTWMVWLLTAVVLAFSATGLRAIAYKGAALKPSLEGQDVDVVGVVSTMPQPNLSGVRFRMIIEQAKLGGSPVQLPESVDVGWYSGGFASADHFELMRPPAVLVAGERWRMRLRLKAPHGSSNPMGFDYELWLWEQGVQATAYVRTGVRDPAPERLQQTGWHPVEWLRQSISHRLHNHLPNERTTGVLAALLVGEQNAIDRADWDTFRATGISHLLSISGLHITMLAWAAGLLVAATWRRSGRLALALPTPDAAMVVGVLAALAYSVFAGWGVPAQRTCLMLGTVALLRLTGLQWPRPAVWLLALTAVVAVDPWALLQAGFWLSFVAVGLLFIRGPEPLAVDWPARLRALVQEQIYISLALAPLSLMLFGQVSVVGLLANLLAIPWVTLVVTPSAMVGALFPLAWDVAGWAVTQMLWVLDSMAQWPFTVWTLPRPSWIAGLSALAGGLWLALPQPWPMRLMGIPLLLPVLLAQPPAPPVGEFRVLVPDIGQGNAVLVRTAQHTLLVDAGPRYSLESDAGHRVVVPLLQALQWKLDIVVLTHRDIDHVGGAAAVLAMQPQARVLASFLSNTGGYRAVDGAKPVELCAAGQRWDWDGVTFEVLFPDAADYAHTASPNARSCVVRISNGRTTVLLVGDIEQPQEALLLERWADLKADVLLVPHHGSKTSSSAEFLDAVQPRWALVQSGYRNRFGHPAQPVLQRLEDRHILVRDSPHCGAMTWESTQADALTCYRQAAGRYWNHSVP